jgi:hypothetical protein
MKIANKVKKVNSIKQMEDGKSMVQFAGVKITEESMQKAREWFADNAQACIDEVRNGNVIVNDPETYYEWCEERKRDAAEGRIDHTFTFLQRAHFIQTGECVPLFSR